MIHRLQISWNMDFLYPTVEIFPQQPQKTRHLCAGIQATLNTMSLMKLLRFTAGAIQEAAISPVVPDQPIPNQAEEGLCPALNYCRSVMTTTNRTQCQCWHPQGGVSRLSIQNGGTHVVYKMKWLICQDGQGSSLYSTDLARAYRILPMDCLDWPLTSVHMDEGFFMDVSL